MCTDYWSQLKGWTKSFTGLEKILTIVEVVLLIAFFVSFFYVIDHIIHCQYSRKISAHDDENLRVYETTSNEEVSVTCTYIKLKSTTSFNNDKSSTETANETIADVMSTTESEIEEIKDDTDVNTERDASTATEPGTIGIKSESEDDKDTDSGTENVSNLNIPGQNLPKKVTKATVKPTKEVTSTTTGHVCTWKPQREPINKLETEQFIDFDKFYRDFVASLVFINDPDITFRCILVVVSKKSLIARASCLYHLKGSVATDYFVLKLFPDDVKKHKLYEVAGLSYHPLILESGLEMYNYAVVKTDEEIDMRTQQFPVIPMNFDIMSIYVGQKVILLGFVRFISTTQHQNPVTFQGHLVAESDCSEPPPLKLFSRAGVDDTSKFLNSSKFHCITFLNQAPKEFSNFSMFAPVFRGLKFLGFLKQWNKRKLVPFVSLIGVRDWIQDVISMSI